MSDCQLMKVAQRNLAALRPNYPERFTDPIWRQAYTDQRRYYLTALTGWNQTDRNKCKENPTP